MDLLPMTPAITFAAFRPNVSREQAIRAFSDQARSPWQRVRGTGPLRSVAELYVPFTLFRATIRHRNTADIRLLAADRFCGALDPFLFAAEADPLDLTPQTSRNRLDSMLSVEETQRALATKVQRMMFQKGFFKVSGLEINLTAVLTEFYMPYWLGFYGSGSRASLRILDATRRVYEGNKFRMGVEDWLRK